MGHTGAHKGQIRTNKGTGGHIRGIQGHIGSKYGPLEHTWTQKGSTQGQKTGSRGLDDISTGHVCTAQHRTRKDYR